MSVKVSSYVWQHSKHRGTTKLVLLALADYANDSGVCWPSAATIAGRVNESERNVRQIIRNLVDSGDLLTSPGGGRGHTTRYGIAVGLNDRQKDKLNSVLQNTVSTNTEMSETVKSGVVNSDLQRTETVKSGVADEVPFTAPESAKVAQSGGGIHHGSVIDPLGVNADAANAAPRPPRKRTKKTDDKQPTPVPIREALADVCKIGKLSPAEQVLQLNQSAAAIWKAQAPEGHDPETVAKDIRYVASYFAKHDWRGKKGDLPRPADIRQNWQAAMDAKPKPIAQAAPATPKPSEPTTNAQTTAGRLVGLLRQRNAAS